MAPASPSPVALVHVPAKRPDGSTNLIERLDVRHVTLVPGWSVTTDVTPLFGTAPSIGAETAGVTVAAIRSILGAVRAGVFFFNSAPTTEIYTLSLHDALPTSIPT